MDRWILLLLLSFLVVACDKSEDEQGAAAPIGVSTTPGIQPISPTTQPAFAELMLSGAFRDRGVDQLTIAEEGSLAVERALPMGYREITDIDFDDDGYHSSSVVIKAIRSSNECGMDSEFDSIDKKIADCAAKNSHSLWKGEDFGVSGESLWKLVVLTSDGKEVWMDSRTKILWSDNLGATNWCKAAGNDQDLPNNSSMIECSVLGAGESWCTDPTLKGIFKGELDDSLVSWRLPTRSDWMMADIDGVRHVLPEMNHNFWSATIYSAARQNAWIYAGNYGTISTTNRSNLGDRYVRCIGRIAD